VDILLEGGRHSFDGFTIVRACLRLGARSSECYDRPPRRGAPFKINITNACALSDRNARIAVMRS
jgi:hypothetical protein